MTLVVQLHQVRSLYPRGQEGTVVPCEARFLLDV